MLEVNNVHSGYGDVKVLQDVSLTVEEGEIVSVLGPNGAGKTTLARTIYGVIPVMEGEMTYKEEKIDELPPNKMGERGMGYSPQDDSIFRSLNVRENLKMGAHLNEENFAERFEEIVNIFPRLEERLDQTAATLSGGERQMLSLGIALMLDPDFLIVDEPSLGLQPNLVEESLEKIKNINQEEDVTILMIEQSAPKALEISDKIYVLAAGEITFSGSPADLKSDEELSEMYLMGESH